MIASEMVQIAYILLCHKDPEAIIAQARRLTAVGDCVAIHLDAGSPGEDFRRIRAALAGNSNVVFAARRRKCGWGDWSLVAATLETARAAYAAFPRATHFYLLSGDCMPIKSAEYAHAFLAAEDADFIESEDFENGGWIKTGFQEERLVYRHFFNERRRKWLFYRNYELQKRLGLRRKLPEGLQIRIGSQWWCLRRQTIAAVLDFARTRRDLVRFFSTTWIPDEIFFQTAVRHLVPREEIRSRTLTFLVFSDYGMPVSFYNDHHDLLLSQDALFARKISPEAVDLKTRLGRLYSATGVSFQVSGEGRGLFHYLTGRGREGRRFGQRFWESGGLQPHRELLVIACKKWHVAKRLAAVIRLRTGIPAVGYLFQENDAGLPDLGGIETDVEKRSRHRRVLVSLLFDAFESDRLAICLDPSMLDTIRDFTADTATLRLLEIQCDMADGCLAGHARRVGLAGDGTRPEVLAELVDILRNDFARDSAALRGEGLPGPDILREGAPARENALSLASFLSIPDQTAREIASAEDLFAD